MSTISVLMSVYHKDKPAGFDRALKSVWTDQTLKPDEIVLVEDGPLNDELYNIVKKWEGILGDKLIVLKNEQNIGLTKSLNKGIKVVSGKYIARMDSDDVSMPERFQLQLRYMESHPEVAASSGSVNIYNGEGDFLYTKKFPLTDGEARRWICKSSPLSHPCSFMRSEIFKSGISYNEEYRTTQDFALWFDILSKGYQLGNIPEPLLRFEYDDNLFKRRSKEKAKNEFRIYMNGIRSLYGSFSWRYVYPVMRYIFRRLPLPIIKLIYNSKLKNKIS